MALCRDALAAELGAVEGQVAQLDHAQFAGDPQHLDEQIGEALPVDLAEVADGAEVGPVVADDGQEGEIAFAGSGDLAAGEDADAIAIEQQGGHHGDIEGRGAAGLPLVVGVEGVQVELGDQFDQEEDQIVLRKDVGGNQRSAGVDPGAPRGERSSRTPSAGPPSENGGDPGFGTAADPISLGPETPG